MIGRRAIIGLSLLSALLFCAFAAQSASAATKSVNTTMFTCVKTEVGDFIDGHCDTTGVPGKEQFSHVAIPNDTTTEVDTSNLKVTNSTKDAEPWVIKSKVAGAKVTIECTTVKNNTAKSLVHNVESGGIEKKHTLTGSTVTEDSACTVKEPAKCTVAEPIVFSSNVEGVEGLEGPKGEKNAMGLEFKGAGAEETFGEIEFKNKGEEKCAVGGKKFPVKGSMIGTCGPTTESVQTNKECGATEVFTPKFEMQKLKVGAETAELTTIATRFMAGPEGKPISTTTVT
jgi:hypothetical protein